MSNCKIHSGVWEFWKFSTTRRRNRKRWRNNGAPPVALAFPFFCENWKLPKGQCVLRPKVFFGIYPGFFKSLPLFFSKNRDLLVLRKPALRGGNHYCHYSTQFFFCAHSQKPYSNRSKSSPYPLAVRSRHSTHERDRLLACNTCSPIHRVSREQRILDTVM